MAWVDSATPVPVQAVPDPCNPTEPKSSSTVRVLSPLRTTDMLTGNYNGNPISLFNLHNIEAQTITFSAATYLLQDGSIEPIYPLYQGAFVYDLYLKKWGKAKHQYRKLFEMFPINSQAGNIIPYDVFGSDTAILDAAGLIYLHDKFPLSSQIVYGKVGFYRKGHTDCEEIRLQLSELGVGILSIEGSLDGKNLSALIGGGVSFTDENEKIAYIATSARWYNIKIEGIFDITGLEFRGHQRGKR